MWGPTTGSAERMPATSRAAIPMPPATRAERATTEARNVMAANTPSDSHTRSTVPANPPTGNGSNRMAVYTQQSTPATRVPSARSAPMATTLAPRKAPRVTGLVQ